MPNHTNCVNVILENSGQRAIECGVHGFGNFPKEVVVMRKEEEDEKIGFCSHGLRYSAVASCS